MSVTGQGRNLATIIGSNIRREREKMGKTQHEFAVLMGGKVNGQRISDWERGTYRPNDTSLLRLAELVGHDYAWFFTDRDERAA